jgi:plasmid stabilization system protein ParE
MTYRARLQPPAENDLEEAYLWAAQHAPEAASRWLRRLHEALQALSENPQRCGLALEPKKLKRDLRELHFGTKPNVLGSAFLIEADVVRILRIRRAARRALTRGELSEE